jgi:hypothetical protein
MSFITSGYKIETMIALLTVVAFFGVISISEGRVSFEVTLGLCLLVLGISGLLLSFIRLKVGFMYCRTLGIDFKRENTPFLFYFYVYVGFIFSAVVMVVGTMLALKLMDLATLQMFIRWVYEMFGGTSQTP